MDFLLVFKSSNHEISDFNTKTSNSVFCQLRWYYSGCSEWAWPQKSFGGFSSNMHCTKSILLHELKMSKSSKGFLFQLIRFLSVKKMNLDEELTGKDLILAHWFRLRACLLSINKTHILISFFERYSWDESLSVLSVWVKRRINDRHTEKETESVAGV